jgi:hypothetical protein
MSIHSNVNAYWQLFRLLAMPSRYQYWFLLMSIGCALLGVLAWPFGYWWLGLPSVAFFGLWLVFAGLVIHGQLLAVASNRSLGLLHSIRRRALVIHALIMTLIAVILGLLQVLRGEALISSLVVSWALCSLVSFGFVASLVWSPQYGLFILYLLGIGLYYVVWSLLNLPVWLYLGVAVLAWWVYARWWLQWRPKKRINNPFMAVTWGARQRTHKPSSVWRTYSGVKRRLLLPLVNLESSPRDLYMSLLMGGATSPLNRLINWLVFTAFFILIWLLFYTFAGMGVLYDMVSAFSGLMFWGFLCGAGMGFIMWMYHNLARAWLYFPDDRCALFRAIEWRYLQCLLMDSALFCLLGAGVLRVGFSQLYTEISLLLWLPLYFLIVVSFWWLYFQCVWLLYCYTQGSLKWWSFAIVFGVAAQLMLAASVWWLVEWRGQALEHLAILFILSFLLLSLALRPLAQKASRRMTFARRAT